MSDIEVRDIINSLNDRKEQEAVEPHYNAWTNRYECGVCHYSMTYGMHRRGELIPVSKVGFCVNCKWAVKWK